MHDPTSDETAEVAYDDIPTVEHAANQAPLAEGPGTVIGPYRLIRQLGEGGFGVVYLAEQHEPVRRQVALKIIKLGMDTRQVIARFETERQVLALMDHPLIARVLDAGATDTGRPYFVMDLVRGIPITYYCDKNRVPFRERLQLFMDVCGAVQHAHQKGVIHRDLKPGNILVTEVDGKPVPKVIDFGIAKATHRGLAPDTVLTREGYFIGTPTYMSPEQADPDALDVDTRSDIYSLGVVLYELLAGVTPFELHTLQAAAVAEVRRQIRDVDPSRPSARVSTLGKELPTVARRRGLEPGRLSSELRGDLDWIVLKALEKDRTRRYESASGLVADIRRHLADEPVEASPPSATYRMRKLVRRNRGAFAAAMAVLAVLLLGVAGTTYGLWRAIGAEHLARAERDEARRQTEIAQAVNDFLNDDLLSAVQPSSRAGQGRDVPMREVLDQASTRIEEAGRPGGKFADKPSIEAQVRETLGKTYRALGDHETASSHLRRALELRERSTDDPLLLAGTLHILGFLAVQQGDYAAAEDFYRRSVEIHTEAGDPDAGLDTKAGLAIALREQNRMDEAEALLLDVLERQKRKLGEEHLDTVVTMSNLANLYQMIGRNEESEELNRRMLAIRIKVEGEDSPNTLATLNNLANVLASQGRPGEAGELMQRVLETKRRIFGPEHPNTLNTMNNIGEVEAMFGNWSEAERWHRETLALRAKVLGERHPRTTMSRRVLAFALAMQGRFEEGRTEAARAEQEFRAELGAELGAEHQLTMEAAHTRAICLLGLGRPAEAAPIFRQVAAFMAAAGQDELFAQSTTYLAIAEARLGHREDAEALLRAGVPALPKWNAETPLLLRQVITIVEAWNATAPSAELAATLEEYRQLLTRAERETAAAAS